jgi:hypothetical protein
MNLVMQSFGREYEYKRAILTIYSFYAHYGWPSAARVILFTDNAAYFKPYLEPFPVDYVFLSPGKIKDMRGEIDFLHRMKIVLIDEALQRTTEKIFYVDSDTFFIANPKQAEEIVSPKVSFMHVKEYDFASLKDKPLPAGRTFRAFYELIVSQRFDVPGNHALSIPPAALSWNAGAMVLHPAHRAWLGDVYALTDQFYPATGNHASEQYAFSVVLQQRTNVRSCSDIVYHYWYRVEKRIADLCIEKNITVNWCSKSVHARLEDIRMMTDMLPAHFKNHLLMLQDQAIQSFNENDFKLGRKQAFRAWLRKPWDIHFLRHVVYHLRRSLGKTHYTT